MSDDFCARCGQPVPMKIRVCYPSGAVVHGDELGCVFALCGRVTELEAGEKPPAYEEVVGQRDMLLRVIVDLEETIQETRGWPESDALAWIKSEIRKRIRGVTK